MAKKRSYHYWRLFKRNGLFSCSSFILICSTLCPSSLALTVDVFREQGLSISDETLRKWSYFPSKERERMRQQVKEMFYFSYDNYLQHAFPLDELDPVHCRGRGPDWENPSNININDVLGNYSLTMIDALDTLLVIGNGSEFHRAVRLIRDTVSFDQDVTVQVFEATIRVVGGLLSAHFLLTSKNLFPEAYMEDYEDELLDLARDLVDRLIDALEPGSLSGLPYPRVNLRHGIQMNAEKMDETCLAGAGSLLLEMGLVGILAGDPVPLNLAKRVVKNLWSKRSNVTGLFGNTLNVPTGEWLDKTSGIGAGMDSFYEYLLKGFIVFGDEELYEMWKESYQAMQVHHRMGSRSCGTDAISHPLYVNVLMDQGEAKPTNVWVDSLGAAFPAVQVLDGDVKEALCLHNVYTSIWRHLGLLPERFDWFHEQTNIPLYPLRPELAESTYFLYRATRNPFYLHVGKMIIQGLEGFARTTCGFATVHSVLDGSLEDRMESFFLSETLKYLYLLFDEENPLNRNEERIVFTTEGHIIPLMAAYQRQAGSNEDAPWRSPRGQVCFAQHPLLRYALPVDNIAWKGATTATGTPNICSSA